MARLLGQMLLLPFSVFVYSMELFVRTVQGVERVAGEGLDLTVGQAAPEREETASQPHAGVGNAGGRATVAEAGGQAAESGYQSTQSVAEGNNRAGTEFKTEETKKEAGMDRDLRDDMLKLVRYKVLFVKREYEHAFPEREDLVSENMDGAAFTAWKVAEFIQELQLGETRVPEKWRKYGGGKCVEERGGSGGGKWLVLKDLPHEDKKYLRVYYEVMDRYPREKFKYEEQQIRVLEEIRDELRDC
jgi:hypothetical protein